MKSRYFPETIRTRAAPRMNELAANPATASCTPNRSTA